MKYILTFFLLLMINTSYSQNYTQAIGFRGGYTSGVTYRQYIDDNEALEGIISWKTKGLIISVIKQFSEPYSFDFSDHLFVCYGYGGHFGYKYSDHYNSFFGRFNYQSKKISPIVGMDGYLGLEYRIYELPFIFGIDYKPFFEFSTRQYFRLQLGDVAFAVKYRF